MAIKEELVCRMSLIVHLLALIPGHLPAVANELVESLGFSESVDYSTFVLNGEHLGLPHFKTQKMWTLSPVNLSCISKHKDCRLWGVTIHKVIVSLDLMFLWYWRVKQQRRWSHFCWCFGGKSSRVISFLHLIFCAISMGGLGQCFFQQLSFTWLGIFIKLPELLRRMAEVNVLFISVPHRLSYWDLLSTLQFLSLYRQTYTASLEIIRII